jgi:hypothetical protein
MALCGLVDWMQFAATVPLGCAAFKDSPAALAPAELGQAESAQAGLPPVAPLARLAPLE